MVKNGIFVVRVGSPEKCMVSGIRALVEGVLSVRVLLKVFGQGGIRGLI